MKGIALLVGLIFVFGLTSGTANALENNFEVSLAIGSGEISASGVAGTADSDSMELSVFFTHYFDSLETNEVPYGVREFLQHPSQAGAGFNTYDLDATDDAGDTLDYRADSLYAGGIYYTQSEEHATGIGVAYGSSTYNMTLDIGGIPLSVDGDKKSVELILEQYLSKTAKLTLAYAMIDGDLSGTSHDETVALLAASGLIDNVWLSGYYLTGKDDWPSGYSDDDISGLGLEVGVYVNQKTGLFFSYDSMTKDDGSSEIKVTDLSFKGDFYADEKTHIIGALILHEEDDPTFITFEDTILKAGVGFYF